MATAETKESNSDLSKTDVTCEEQPGAGSTVKVTAATSLASPEPTRTKYDATNDEDGIIKVTTATNLAIPNLTQSEVDDIRDAFQLFDVDGCGSIDPKDLKEALDGLGYSDKNPAVYAMLTKIDAASLDRNGRLSFDEFLSAMKGNLGAGSNSKEDVDKIFNLFDNDKTGYISLYCEGGVTVVFPTVVESGAPGVARVGVASPGIVSASDAQQTRYGPY